jgi:hypothetical protein
MANLLSVLKLHAKHIAGLFLVLGGMLLVTKSAALGNPVIALGILLHGSGIKDKTALLAAAVNEGESIVSDIVSPAAPTPPKV